jgi:hypothetical protein
VKVDELPNREAARSVPGPFLARNQAGFRQPAAGGAAMQWGNHPFKEIISG